MSRGSYTSVNLTRKQKDFLILMDEYDIDIFQITDIENILERKIEDLNEILENLAEKKILSRIERGKYCRHNFRDEYVISQYLVSDGVIAYWSALNYHSLTEQFPNIIFVQTIKSKLNKSIFGTAYKFVKVTDNKYTGYNTVGSGNHKFRITDVEKTLVDCFDLVQYSGGYAELIRAFSQHPSESKKLIKYAGAVNNISVLKRMGFLAEMFPKRKLDEFIAYAKSKVNSRYNLFDPFGPDKGEFINEWKLRLNINKEAIKDICQITS